MACKQCLFEVAALTVLATVAQIGCATGSSRRDEQRRTGALVCRPTPTDKRTADQNRPSKEEVLDQMKRAGPHIEACFRVLDGHFLLDTRFGVDGSNGRVFGLSLMPRARHDRATAISEEQSLCVAEVFTRVCFAPFSGEPQWVTYPFEIH